MSLNVPNPGNVSNNGHNKRIERPKLDIIIKRTPVERCFVKIFHSDRIPRVAAAPGARSLWPVRNCNCYLLHRGHHSFQQTGEFSRGQIENLATDAPPVPVRDDHLFQRPQRLLCYLGPCQLPNQPGETAKVSPFLHSSIHASCGRKYAAC